MHRVYTWSEPKSLFFLKTWNTCITEMIKCFIIALDDILSCPLSLPTHLTYLYWLHHLRLIKHRVQFQVQKAAWKQSIPLFSADPRNTFPFQLSFGIPFRAMGCTFEYPLEQWRHQFPFLSIQWVRFRIAIGFIPIVPTLFCLSITFTFVNCCYYSFREIFTRFLEIPLVHPSPCLKAE